MRSSGPLFKALKDAFLEAFDRPSLRMFLRESLDESLQEITSEARFEVQVYELLDWAERQGRLVDLVNAAAAHVPGNQALQEARDALHDAAHPDYPPTPEEPTRCRLYGVTDTRSVEFLGRSAELAQLEDLLCRDGSSVRIAAAVEGLAGIGKTELALQLVHHLAETSAFPGGIFWFDAENPDLTTAWGTSIADQLKLPGETPADRAATAVRRVSDSGSPTLLVLDNVERWTASEQPGPLPTSNHVKILVTTRLRRLGGTRFQHLSLGFLKPRYARDLLLAVADRELAEASGFEELLEHLGGHALAVELAGAYLCEYPEETPASYLEALKAGGEIDPDLGELVRYNRTVFQAFEAIWAQLDETTQAAWRLASCFEPEFAEPSLADAVGLDRQRRRKLRRLHLIEDDAGGRWRLHRLTRDFGRQAGSEEELAEARKAYVQGCLNFSRGIDVVAGFRLYLPNRPHLDAALVQAEEIYAGDSHLSELQDRIGTALQSAGDLQNARTLLEKALQADLANLGEVHPAVATSRSNLALVLKDLGDLENARILLEQALQADLANLGEDHPAVATSRSNLALVLKDLGDLENARTLFEQALQADLANLGEDHPSVTTSRSNLALVLKDLGELENARILLEQALRADLAKLWDDHPSVATSRSNLALVLKDLGDLENARTLLEQALQADLANLGADHPSVATSRSNLALVLKDLGDLENARTLLEQALQAARANFGEDHPSVAASHFNLALICRAEGDLTGAEELLQQTLGAYRLHQQSGLAAYAQATLADVLHERGENERAQAEAREALDAVAGQPAGSIYKKRVVQAVAKILN